MGCSAQLFAQRNMVLRLDFVESTGTSFAHERPIDCLLAERRLTYSPAVLGESSGGSKSDGTNGELSDGPHCPSLLRFPFNVPIRKNQVRSTDNELTARRRYELPIPTTR